MENIFNPYLPSSEYVPDGEPHVFGDRVYIYGSHDKARIGFRYFSFKHGTLSVMTRGASGKLFVFLDDEKKAIGEVTVHEGEGMIAVNEICFEEIQNG